ncbi:MAG: hypothetical protein WCG12_06905 [Alcaligenaceae bacterium]
MKGWKKISLTLIVAVFSVFGGFQQSVAADISVSAGKDGSVDLIIIKGDITAEDERKFKQIALNSEFATVVLDSPGGLLRPAIAIGKTIRIKEFSTAVVDAECLSSCALIWLAGDVRYMAKNSKVGFHAAYIEDKSGKTIPAATGNALVGSYLNSLGLNESIVAFVTKAGATEVNWLNKDGADRLGLPVSIINNRRKAVADFDLALKGRADNRTSIDETIKLYRSSADAGFAGAQNNLGDMYENGERVEKNKQFAVYWYTRAAERGEPTAYFSLSTILSDESQDEGILIEALKFALLALQTLPEGLNITAAQVTARKILAMLPEAGINRAVDLARDWDPLYQEKYLMGDTVSDFSITEMPKQQIGNARAVNLKGINSQSVSQGYTQPVSAQGFWSLSSKNTKPNRGKLTSRTSASTLKNENGIERLTITDEHILHSGDPDVEAIKMNSVSLIDPSSFRVIRNTGDESTTDYQFSTPPKETMNIHERIHVGVVQARDKSGTVIETGVVFEELRMSLEELGALEFCQVEHTTSVTNPKNEKLSYWCEIFRENEVASGQVAYIFEASGKSVYKVRVRYSPSTEN